MWRRVSVRAVGEARGRSRRQAVHLFRKFVALPSIKRKRDREYPAVQLISGFGTLGEVNGEGSYGLPYGGLSDEERLRLQEEERRVMLLIRAFKQHGHLVADLDPLRIHEIAPRLHQWRTGERWLQNPEIDSIPLRAFKQANRIDPRVHDLKKSFFIGDDLRIGPVATLENILEELQHMFCGKIGLEYHHLADQERESFVQELLQRATEAQLSAEEKRDVYRSLIRAEMFERYLGRRYSGAKRFSLEGAEALIPGLVHALRHASALGVDAVHIGMAHRGRLNVLANVLEKRLALIMSQFQAYLPDSPDYPNNSDDVRYHLGTTVRKFMENTNRVMEICLASNPSHLEAVNSVVLGQVRAAQFKRGNERTVMPLLLHGDAAMYQGSVREAFGLETLKDYRVGGTVHVIINNQIGFTTLPKNADSAVYCSDVAKITQCPVFHVNGDDPRAVIEVLKGAVEYRQKFNRDVVVDLICYRRHGHNEQDSPEITAPKMYYLIRQHPTLPTLFGRQLEKEGVMTKEERDRVAKEFKAELQSEHDYSTVNPTGWDTPADRPWDVANPSDSAMRWYPETLADEESEGEDEEEEKSEVKVLGGEQRVVTGVTKRTLEKLGRLIFAMAPEMNLHPKVEAIMNNRLRAVDVGTKMDWGTAEALCWASLLLEGVDVRISGQDCERGTFNQRHAVLYSQYTDSEGLNAPPREMMPLNLISNENQDEDVERTFGVPADRRGRVSICNSPLSEEAVLAFEYGYSSRSLDSLTIWEAQFGDFANGAQIVIDTFLVSGEQKWLKQSNLVLLLPHGYEGQGPDHSSARIERFLQMCNDPETKTKEWEQACKEVNIHVVQCTTPAQYFHLLRLHMKRDFKKPLIIFSPKYLLHHRPCHSDLVDLCPENFFHPVLPVHPEDQKALKEPEEIRRLILCSGKVYWHYIHAARTKNVRDIATARIEQLSPFPYDEVKEMIGKYPKAEIVWLQEEPRNMGPWSFVAPRIEAIRRDLGHTDVNLRYIGRPSSASPATASFELHQQEMRDIITEAVE